MMVAREVQLLPMPLIFFIHHKTQKKMETKFKKIKKGEVFIFESDALPIFYDSNFYVDGAKVVPDEVNFLSALTYDGTKVAIHSSETHMVVSAKDEVGNNVFCIKNTYPYIRATDSRGNSVFFTSEQAAENANYKFSFRLRRFHDANCDEFYGDEKLLDYHTSQNRIDRSKLIQYHNENDEWLVGLEVEKVDSNLQLDGDAWEILTNSGWSKERDGSLGTYGYELVSPILPLYDNVRIDNAIAPVRKWVNGKSNEKCGGHITISNKHLTTENLLISFQQFVPILYSLYPNRIGNEYCYVKEWSKYFSYPERRSAFNLKDDRNKLGGRVEIRLFSRVANEKTLKWRLELLQMFLKDKCNLNQFAQKIGCPESAYYKHFAKQYSHEQIGGKLVEMDKYSVQYKTHRKGLAPSVKKRINNTMGYDVFGGL